MFKLLKASVFLISLLSLSNQLSTSQTNNFLSSVSQTPISLKKSILYFNIDDEVTHIYINGNQVKFNFNCGEAGIWYTTHTQSFYLFGGDKLTVVGKDTKANITGFVGTLHYFNKYGQEKIINTGNDWTCDDKPATLKGKNDGSVRGWPRMPLIDTNAQWIWNDKPLSSGTEISCSYEIPCDL